MMRDVYCSSVLRQLMIPTGRMLHLYSLAGSGGTCWGPGHRCHWGGMGTDADAELTHCVLGPATTGVTDAKSIQIEQPQRFLQMVDLIMVMIWYCVTMSQWSFLHPWPGGWQRTRPRTLPGDGAGGGQTTYQNRNNKLCFLTQVRYITATVVRMLTEPQIE